MASYSSEKHMITLSHSFQEELTPLDMLILDAPEVMENYNKILIGIGEGLLQLLDQNYNHRNLKPSNVFVVPTSEYHTLIADYLHNSLFKKPQFSFFLSPEQLVGSNHDKSDIWSYGCLIYYLYTSGDVLFSTFELNSGEEKDTPETPRDLLFAMRCFNYEEDIDDMFYENEEEEEIGKLLKQMLNPDADSRMDLNSVVNTIKSIYIFFFSSFFFCFFCFLYYSYIIIIRY